MGCECVLGGGLEVSEVAQGNIRKVCVWCAPSLAVGRAAIWVTLSPQAQEGRDPESACAEVGAACPNSGQWDVDGSDVYHPQT